MGHPLMMLVMNGGKPFAQQSTISPHLRFIFKILLGGESKPINETKQQLIKMIFLTQLIYIKEEEQQVFDQFENIAIPIISKYNGRLLLRVRPTENTFIEHHMDKPYEIHLVEFPGEQDFEDFKKDEERKKFLHLKEQSIESVWLIKVIKL